MTLYEFQSLVYRSEIKNIEDGQGSVAVYNVVPQKGGVVPVCTIKASEGSRGKGPLILNLGIREK